MRPSPDLLPVQRFNQRQVANRENMAQAAFRLTALSSTTSTVLSLVTGWLAQLLRPRLAALTRGRRATGNQTADIGSAGGAGGKQMCPPRGRAA
jgi:hypothetical protein